MSARSLAVAGLLAASAVPAQAAVVVDQSTLLSATVGSAFTASSIQRGNGLNRIQSQSVTAGKAGRLTRIDLQVEARGGTGDLILSLASGAIGQPGYTALGNFTVARADVPTAAASFAGGLVSVDVSSLAFDVAPGTVFSIGLGAIEQQTGINAFGWVLGESNGVTNIQLINYAGGELGLSNDGGTSWLVTENDRGFRTFVDTGAVPEPGSWAMLIAGFGLTGAVMRRRRLATV